MTTGMIAGRRLVRSLMNLPSERRAWRRRVSKSVAPSSAASCSEARTAAFASSSSSSASGAYTQPRVTISGPVTTSPVVGVDGDDHHDEPLLGEVAAVAQHAEADVADDAVDVLVARRAPRAARRRWRSCRRRRACVSTSPSSQTSTWSVRHADRLGQPRVVDHVAVLAVHRHEPLGLHEVEEELQLLLRRVPRHVHRRAAAVDHLGAGAVQRVDDARHVRSRCRGSRARRSRRRRRSLIFTCLCSCAAMSDSALIGSPCDPVQMTHTSPGA